MTTKAELLLNLLDTIKETLVSIQQERFDVNANERSLQSKKRITNENFQKLIKLKNEDFNTILLVENEILASGEESDEVCAYNKNGIKDKILTIGKCFDQTFSVVDQMKRETEFLENTSTEFEDDSLPMTGGRSNEYFENKNDSNSCGDSNSTTDAIIQDNRSNNDYIKEIFGKPLTKALASVILYQPNDPIDYLAKFLHNYRNNE